MEYRPTRTRWAAVGAAVAVSLGAGGIGVGHATIDDGDRPVLITIEPCRLADTRPAPDTVGPRTTGIGPAETYDLDGWGDVGDCTLPSGTTGLALNVTAVGATRQTNLRLFPAGTAVPNAANLNPTPGSPPTPNAVTVGLDAASGRFSVYNAFGRVAVVIDVVGYYDGHTHDDRYPSHADVEAAIANGIETSSEAVTGPGLGLPASLTVQRQYLAEAITTSAPGQLSITKYGRVSIGCTSGARLYFLVVDDVPLPSSVVYRSDGAFWDGQITGTTDGVIAAGDHTIAIGGQCYVPANYDNTSAATIISSSSVTVIP